ncbi:hypothetical protein AAHE18_11G041500 [Arachis hypogaea]
MLVATETKVFGVICFNRVVKVLFGCSADDFFHFAKLHPFCELNGHDTGDQSSDGNIIGETSNLLYEEDGTFSPKIDFDDGDLDDDGIEPAIREKIDRYKPGSKLNAGPKRGGGEEGEGIFHSINSMFTLYIIESLDNPNSK